MSAREYRWALELYRDDGSTIGRLPVTVDFEPAREHALFQGMRRRLLAADAVAGSSSILPRWDPTEGPPYLVGFDVRFDDAPGEALGEIGTEYFRPAARKIGVALVADGRLREGEVFRFRPLAFPAAEGAPANESRDVSPGLDLRETALSGLVAGSSVEGAVDEEDFPVFLPERLFEEVRELSRGAGEHETGGFLVGRLHRDASVPEIFLEVTGQLPAMHVISDTDRLTFTERTWTEAQAMLDLRHQGEQWCGWWHRHPVATWCRKCDPEKQRVCRLARDFFSEHDRQVHRAVFPRAYNVALVFNDSALAETSFSLFGWHRGDLCPRGFHLLAGSLPAARGG
jgi:hypothetical protein